MLIVNGFGEFADAACSDISTVMLALPLACDLGGATPASKRRRQKTLPWRTVDSPAGTVGVRKLHDQGV